MANKTKDSKVFYNIYVKFQNNQNSKKIELKKKNLFNIFFFISINNLYLFC